MKGTNEVAEIKGKAWLRDASMRRLSLFVKNKTELIGNAAQLGLGVMYPDNLEKSGLTSTEIFHLEQWVSGIETGRQCMLAILDSRLTRSVELERQSLQTTNKDDFKPVELIRSLMHLPEDFLCDGGYIYETVFQRPPTGVVREALQMLVQTAFEKSPSQLGIEQINLAIKQLRLNNLGGIAGSEVDTGYYSTVVDDAEVAAEAEQKSNNASSKATAGEETFRLQIMIELIRIHIVSLNKKRLAAEAVASAEDSPYQAKMADTDRKKRSDSITAPVPAKLDMPTIEKHLRTPLKVVFEQAETMSSEELEGTNGLLKPYLKQLSSLKVSLAAELKDLQDSRAFLALGLSAEASDEAIKKAYRMLAIRLHPDKPGGDTARFQQLQDSYHEIMRKRKADSAERVAMEEVRNRYRPNKGKPADAGSAGSDKNKSANKEGGAEDKASSEEADVEPESDDFAPSDEEPMVDENGEVILAKEKSKKPVKPVKPAGEKDTEFADRDADAQTEETVPEPEAADEDEAGADPDAEQDNDGAAENTENADDDDEFNVEEVMNGLDGTEDIEEVFRRLSASRSKPYSAESNTSGTAGAAGGASGAAGVGGAKIPGAPPAPVSYESEAEHAQAVVKQIGELLQRIKKAAGECTQLAQLNIKWQKMLDKAMEPPSSLKEVLKVITATTGNKSVLKGNVRTEANTGLTNMDACALQQAIMPVELICDWAQQVAALAMELPNCCGIRYAAAASGNKAFLMAVERSMQLSLGALKTVLGLINSQEQLASCVRRVRDSLKIANENDEIQKLLLEMIRTGIKSNVITISSAVDRIVETAMAASEVRDVVIQLMKDVEQQERAEVKRRAAEQESRQSEEDYCEEDREALRKCREDRRDEDRNARRGSPEEPKEAQKGGNKPENGSLDDLKDKIRLLQVQLKVQHVQALQSMNSEVVLLQGQIMKELQALPFVTSMESLFTASSKKPAQGSAQGSTLAKDSSVEDKDYKTSLLTLVADLVDSACHALRHDLLSVHTKTYVDTPSQSVASIADGAEADAKPSTPQDLLDQHLGWMRIVLADGSAFSKAQLNAVVSALAAQAGQTADAATGVDTADAGASTTASSPPPVTEDEVSMRLALLPDYRAKTLYLASLVDLSAVQDIIGPQLLQRLEEILMEGRECISRANIPAPKDAATSEVLQMEGSGESKGSDGPLHMDAQSGGADAGTGANNKSPAAEVNLNDIDDDCNFDIDLNVDESHDIDVNIAEIDREIEEEDEAAALASGGAARASVVTSVSSSVPAPPPTMSSNTCMPPSPPPLSPSTTAPSSTTTSASSASKDPLKCSGSAANAAQSPKSTANHASSDSDSHLKAPRPPPTAMEGENVKPNIGHPWTA